MSSATDAVHQARRPAHGLAHHQPHDRVQDPDPAQARRRAQLRTHYRLLLGWAFTLFSTLRVVAYLPTLLLIWQQQDSSQHSLLTWCIWLGGNLTMAAWLHETNGAASRGAVLVNLCNATMCAGGVASILWFRL